MRGALLAVLAGASLLGGSAASPQHPPTVGSADLAPAPTGVVAGSEEAVWQLRTVRADRRAITVSVPGTSCRTYAHHRVDAVEDRLRLRVWSRDLRPGPDYGPSPPRHGWVCVLEGYRTTVQVALPRPLRPGEDLGDPCARSGPPPACRWFFGPLFGG